jgi:hypothetical protein
LRSLFGRKDNIDRFKLIQEKNNWFTIYNNYRFGSKNNYTKGYKLSAEVKKVMDQFTNNLISPYLPQEDIIKNTRNVNTLPDKAIRSVDHNGNKARCKAHISPTVEINTQGVYKSLKHLKKLKDAIRYQQKIPSSTYFDPQKPQRLNLAFKQLLTIHDLSFSTLLPFGQIPQCYVESQSGRLYGQGLNLQNIVTEVRKIALSGLPYVEYDLSNCHFNILCQVNRSNTRSIPAIKLYLKDKKRIRNELAKRIGVKLPDIKQCLLAVIYGARSILRKENAIPKLIGLHKATKLFNDSFFQQLQEDIKNAKAKLLDQARRKGDTIINQMGKSIKSSRRKSEIISHLLQGYEAKMLNIALSLYEEQIIILQHDGWISKTSCDTDKIENEINKQLKFRIPIEKKLDYSTLRTKNI